MWWDNEDAIEWRILELDGTVGTEEGVRGGLRGVVVLESDPCWVVEEDAVDLRECALDVVLVRGVNVGAWPKSEDAGAGEPGAEDMVRDCEGVGEPARSCAYWVYACSRSALRLCSKAALTLRSVPSAVSVGLVIGAEI